jgi:hypothetical protein
LETLPNATYKKKLHLLTVAGNRLLAKRNEKASPSTLGERSSRKTDAQFRPSVQGDGGQRGGSNLGKFQTWHTAKMFSIEGEQFRAIHKYRGCYLEISKSICLSSSEQPVRPRVRRGCVRTQLLAIC